MFNFNPFTGKFDETADDAELLDGSNQPATGNKNIQKVDPEHRLTDTDSSEYTRITKTDTDNIATRYNRISQQSGGGGGVDSYTKLLLHCNGSDGSTTFTDDSYSSHTVTANGTTQIDDAQYKFGGASGLFNGSTNDYLSIPDHADFSFGTGDFTIDFWMRPSAFVYYDTFLGNWKTNNTGWVLDIALGGAYIDWWSGGGSHQWSGLSFSSAWYHIAFVRNGNNINLYINGVDQGTRNCTGQTHDGSGNPLTIGGGVATEGQFHGWLDELRVSKGIARWTANFTPPTGEYGGGGSPTPREIKVWQSEDSPLPVERGIQTFGDIDGRTILEGSSIRLNLAGSEVASILTDTFGTAGFLKNDTSGVLSGGSSIDISSDTNLSATTPIVLTGDVLSHADTAVTPGTYPKVTVDQKGHITAGTSSITVSEISDIATTYLKLDTSNDPLTNGLIITVADTLNNSALTLNQNDITNNPNALEISNNGTGNAIYINSSGYSINSISGKMRFLLGAVENFYIDAKTTQHTGNTPIFEVDSKVDANQFGVIRGAVELGSATANGTIFGARLTGYSGGGSGGSPSACFRAEMIADADDTDTGYIAFMAPDFTRNGGTNISAGLFIGTDYNVALVANSGDVIFSGYAPTIMGETEDANGDDLTIQAADGNDDSASGNPFDGGDLILQAGLAVNGGTDGVINLTGDVVITGTLYGGSPLKIGNDVEFHDISTAIKTIRDTDGSGGDIDIIASDGVDSFTNPQTGGNITLHPGLGVNGGQPGKIIFEGQLELNTAAEGDIPFQWINSEGATYFMLNESSDNTAYIQFGDNPGYHNTTYFALNDYSQTIVLNSSGQIYLGDHEGFGNATKITIDDDNYIITVDGDVTLSKSLTLTPLGVAPTSPVEGQMYVDNTSGNHLYIYLNSSWNLII